MSEKHTPSQPVLVLAMPMPVTALPLIGDLVERVYGTGETMLRFEGKQMIVTAPDGGFGPLKRSGKRPPRPSDGDALITSDVERRQAGTVTVGRGGADPHLRCRDASLVHRTRGHQLRRIQHHRHRPRARLHLHNAEAGTPDTA